MKKLLILSLLAATAFPTAAQDAACEIDLGSTVMLLVQAQGLAASGDTQTALTFIDQAQSKLDGFEALCGAAVVEDPVTPVELALTQTFTIEDSSDGSMTFSYPEGWAQTEDGGILVGTSAEVLERDFDDEPPPFFPGEAMFYVDFASVISLSRDGALTPVDLLNELQEAIPPSFGEVTETTSFSINDRPAAQFNVFGAQTELVVMAVDIGDIDGEPIVAQFILLTAPGEQAQFEPTLRAVAESIDYEAP